MSRFDALRMSEHPLVRDKLSRLRAVETEPEPFRQLMEELAILLVVEATRDLALERVEVRTPLGPAQGERLLPEIVAVPVLRAGLGLLDGVLALFGNATVGHVGLYRDEATLKPVSYFSKLPPAKAAQVWLVLDPMLATGGSAAAAISCVKEHGAADVRLISILAAPEGVAHLARVHPGVPIYAAVLDERLDERGFIVPGLGDAGDRLFGTGP